MHICTSPQTDNHASTPPLSFLQAGCSSCHQSNSIKALKAFYNNKKAKTSCIILLRLWDGKAVNLTSQQLDTNLSVVVLDAQWNRTQCAKETANLYTKQLIIAAYVYLSTVTWWKFVLANVPFDMIITSKHLDPESNKIWRTTNM